MNSPGQSLQLELQVLYCTTTPKCLIHPREGRERMTAKGRASAVFSQAAATVAVLIGSFIAANSAVASANLFECQEMNRDSHDLGIAMDKLTVKVVEHITPAIPTASSDPDYS